MDDKDKQRRQGLRKSRGGGRGGVGKKERRGEEEGRERVRGRSRGQEHSLPALGQPRKSASLLGRGSVGDGSQYHCLTDVYN